MFENKIINNIYININKKTFSSAFFSTEQF